MPFIVMVIFRKCHPENYLITVCSKFLVNSNYEAHCQQHFERHPAIEDFTGMDQHTCSFFHQNLRRDHEIKFEEVSGKVVS